MMSVDIAAQRLYSHHLARPDFRTPVDVVRWFGAVQAQDFLGSLYAIGLRLKSATEATVEKAIAEKSIIRTWPMRGTIHYVAAEDARWMLNLLARRGISSNRAMYRRLGLTEAIFGRAHKVVEGALRGGKQLTRGEIYAALEAAGLRTAPEQRGLHMLGYLARHALICLGPRRGKQPTYTLLDEWSPGGRWLEGDEALAELARRYFVSHGPATIQDFAWWCGLTVADAQRGLRSVESKLHALRVVDRMHWCDPKIEGAPKLEGAVVRLLPAYDEFIVAYKDRSTVVDPGHAKYPLFGLGPSVLLDGRTAGTWKRTLTRDSVVVAVKPFGRLSAKERAALTQAARHYADFVGLPLQMRP
jgi:hypothetical protein